MTMTEEIEKRLFENADEEYRQFQARLMPDIEISRIIGVRTPILRKTAKELAKNERIGEFLSDLPHKYYDENNLHGFIVSECKDFEQSVRYVNAILPYVDNWATCDLLSPKAFAKNKEKLIPEIGKWIASDRTFTIRFGIEMLMSHFLDADFDIKYPEAVAKIRSEEYYVNMMIAWYFATALAKQWDSTIPFLEQNRLALFTHNKTIRKAIESYRITDGQKDYLRGLKRAE